MTEETYWAKVEHYFLYIFVIATSVLGFFLTLNKSISNNILESSMIYLGSFLCLFSTPMHPDSYF